jgi:uncharacterized membrane protein YhaH (DUF805 family)
MEWYLRVLQKYADFEGRARRKEYWMFFLFHVIIVVGLIVVGAVLGGIAGAALGRNGQGLAAVIAAIFTGAYILYALGVFIPSLAVTVRRLHDTGRSGWWWLITFVPFGGLVLLVFTVEDSQRGDNQYGPNPKEPPAQPYVGPAPQPGI